MRAKIRDTEIWFDIDGAGLVPDGGAMRQRPVGFLIHGGPGSDHSGFKPSMSPLARHMQLVYFDHRGQGRSGDASDHEVRARSDQRGVRLDAGHDIEYQHRQIQRDGEMDE
jgi:pimeloyl-ACP methyl ester carboxylesterase